MIIAVTGTGTDVGKTVTTAALAAFWAQRCPVTVVKPVQTGDDDDLAEVARMSGVSDTVRFARAPEPLAPVTAARRAGVELPPLDDVARRTRALDAPDSVVLVEGAGGLLVELGEGWTLADLAGRLGAPVVVATRTGLGSLNHLGLTLEALASRNLDCLGVVGSRVSPDPDLAERCTVAELREREDWLGELTDGAAQWPAAQLAAALDAERLLSRAAR